MKYRLMELLVCPECEGAVELEVWKVENTPRASETKPGCRKGCYFDDPSCTRCYAPEILEGVLRCNVCARAYPITGGVPRMLPDDLRSVLWQSERDFFERHPQLIPAVFGDKLLRSSNEKSKDKELTYRSFSFQRVSLKPPDSSYARDWLAQFERLVKPHASSEFAGKLGLDAGCGFGRYLSAAHACGAEIVGLDLSEGVLRAFENNRGNARAHVVQGDICRMPFRAGTFDFAFSFGVLHHLPNPKEGFRSVARAVAQNGDILIWVYGYEGMSWSYRFSHMRALRRLTTRLPRSAQLAVCVLVALALEIVLWLPHRVLGRFRATRKIAERLPAGSNSRQPFAMKVTAVFDRLGTPTTHFCNREELLGWYADAGLISVNVSSTDRKGWQACGEKPPSAPVREEVSSLNRSDFAS